jgi:tetratricopeptide (TPR) repeat protein
LNLDLRHTLVYGYQRCGNFHKRVDQDKTLQYFTRGATLDEELLASDSANAVTRKDLAFSYKRMAETLADREEFNPALLHFRRALELYDRIVEDAPSDLTARFRAIACRAGAAGMAARLGDMDSTAEDCTRALASLDQITTDWANGGQCENKAQGYQFVGYAYRAAADSSKNSLPEQVRYRRLARHTLQRTADILTTLRDRGQLPIADELWAKNIRDEIAKCDAALTTPLASQSPSK